MAYPSYIDAFNSGILRKKIEDSIGMLESCSICPRKCGVNRLKDETGFCRTGRNAICCSYLAHHGEEPAISGTKGSGTIFFSRCNLKCVYCQNFDFSQEEEGRQVSADELAAYMLELQDLGCHNINFVTPTHIMPQILESLAIAVQKGLSIPLVYNTSGYELPEMIKLLDGIVDIYLPDARYAEGTYSARYSSAQDYPEYNKSSIKEMFRQVGRGEFDKEGIIKRGLIIRHLVLPENISGTEKICAFISNELSPQVYVSLMSQYHPCYKACDHPSLDRRITMEEYDHAIGCLKKYGLENGWIQESRGLARFAGTNIKRNI